MWIMIMWNGNVWYRKHLILIWKISTFHWNEIKSFELKNRKWHLLCNNITMTSNSNDYTPYVDYHLMRIWNLHSINLCHVTHFTRQPISNQSLLIVHITMIWSGFNMEDHCLHQIEQKYNFVFNSFTFFPCRDPWSIEKEGCGKRTEGYCFGNYFS
jgi:hypothetical protein